MTPYSMDLRTRVLAACDAGTGTKAVAETFTVSASWVRRLKQQRRAGPTAPKSPRNRRAPTSAPRAEEIRALVTATPDRTLAEIRTTLGVTVALATLWAAVARLGVTVKKKSSGRPSRIART